MDTDKTQVSRRAFLVASAVASAGILVSGQLAAQTSDAAMNSADSHDRRWLVATQRGLYAGHPGDAWELQGGYAIRLTTILRAAGRTVVGGGAGLWEIPNDGNWWLQLHDETLTEVIGLAALAGDPGLLVASAYGVASGRRDRLDAVRWSFHTDALPPDDRFTSAVIVTDTHWIAATEAGVLTTEAGSPAWSPSDLRDTPVRVLTQMRGQLWAGSDRRGIWRSDDGRHWQTAGHGLDGLAVYDLAAAGDLILAATEGGVFVGDGASDWRPVGPHLRVDAIDAAGDTWLAGADPGGLWQSDDAGRSWRQIDGFPDRIAAIAAPEAA